MSIDSMMLSSYLMLCHPLLLPSIFPSMRVFCGKSAVHIRWPKYCSCSVNPSSEYLGLISLRIDWFDLLAVQGTLKSLLQHTLKVQEGLSLPCKFVSKQLSSSQPSAPQSENVSRRPTQASVICLCNSTDSTGEGHWDPDLLFQQPVRSGKAISSSQQTGLGSTLASLESGIWLMSPLPPSVIF